MVRRHSKDDFPASRHLSPRVRQVSSGHSLEDTDTAAGSLQLFSGALCTAIHRTKYHRRIEDVEACNQELDQLVAEVPKHEPSTSAECPAGSGYRSHCSQPILAVQMMCCQVRRAAVDCSSNLGRGFSGTWQHFRVGRYRQLLRWAASYSR
jgi:hypothetical protein